MKTPHPLVAALAAFFAVSSASGAQPAASPASTDEAVVLSPFSVTTDRDTGYVASNTLAGSRLNTPLAVTPAAISVFTKDLLEDIGALNVNAAVEYALGASNDVERTGNNVVANDFNYRIRGFLNASAGRNYFPWSLSSDSFNVERLDFARGPNSILFGAGSPGGIINTTPKQARADKPMESVRFRVASWDDYRLEVDVNRPLARTLAARLNVLYQSADGWREFERLDRKGAALAATWRPTSSTAVQFDGEWGDVKSNRPRPFLAGDGYSLWRAAGSPLSLTYGATAAGSAALGHRISYNPLSGPFKGQAVDFSTFRLSTGPTLVGVPNPPQVLDLSIHPRTVNLMGPGGETNFDYYSAALFVNQTIAKKLHLELAANRQQQFRIRHSAMNFNDNRLEVDINAELPVFNAAGVRTGSAPNPNVGKFFVKGIYTTDESETRRDDVRFTAAYEFDLGRFGQHALAALASRGDGFNESIQRREANVSTARQTADLTSSNNEIRRFTYIDLSNSDPAFRGHQDPRRYPVPDQIIAGTTFRVQSGMYGRTWSDTLNRIDTAMAAMQSTFWNGRLHTTLGARRDRVRNFSSVQLTATDGSRAAIGAFRDDIPELDQSGNTFTTGAVGKITDWVSVFYNQSENFQPQSSTIWSLAGAPVLSGSVVGEGRDYGVKFNFLGGRLNATVGSFTTDQKNLVGSLNGLYQVYFESMWAALGQNIDLNGGDTRASKSKGYEVELTANLTKLWRLAFNFGHIATKDSDLLPALRAYNATHRATFAAQPTRAIDRAAFPTSQATIGAVLSAVDALIAADTATEGQTPRRHRENTGNLVTNYRFDTGALKGVGLGLGAQYRGGALIGYTMATPTQPVAAVVSKPYTIANAVLSYERRILGGRARWKIQLNVDNLFDFDTLQPVDSGYDSAGNLVALGMLQMPRRYALTNTFTF